MEVTAHVLAPCGSGTSLVDILAVFCAWASEGFGLAERLSFSSTTLGTSYGNVSPNTTLKTLLLPFRVNTTSLINKGVAIPLRTKPPSFTSFSPMCLPYMSTAGSPIYRYQSQRTMIPYRRCAHSRMNLGQAVFQMLSYRLTASFQDEFPALPTG
ncbi:hypothetical protein N656DRAFT_615626 [Canariomyces notabilis]|uniref:Uncharacterized protein n=1 Tax=Canariomyces notabilis TaxID=2074819 RepID=A0AAN6TFC0_9PEZI|nr:hypothetical protein N656DRAFT_615626 [Canariomyces arenarius]